MTVIAAIKTEDKVYIAGDRAVSEGWNVQTHSSPKVFKKNGLVFAATGSVRTIQAVRFRMSFEEWIPERKSFEEFVRINVVDSMVSAMKADGSIKCSEGKYELPDRWLVAGPGGKLIEIAGGCACEVDEPYLGIGCGGDFALGSLYETAKGKMDPKKRLETAVEAACRFSAGCGLPVDIFEI